MNDKKKILNFPLFLIEGEASPYKFTKELYDKKIQAAFKLAKELKNIIE